MSPAALAGEPGARRISPLLLLLVILSFFLVFAGVSCNTETTRSTIGSIEASQGVSAAATAQVNACIDGLSGVNVLAYSGWQLAFGGNPWIGSVPAACQQSGGLPTIDTSSANIGPQLPVMLALVSVALALVFAIAGALGLLAARTRAVITAVFAAAAGALLIVDQLHVRDVLLAKIASSAGSSGPGFLGITSLFSVNPGIGLVLALVILAVAVLYNVAAIIVTPVSEAAQTPEPPPPLSPPP
ncbi:MAG: hypothetical protein WAL84_15295 [Candidatus Dormiibacterota bacterium]